MPGTPVWTEPAADRLADGSIEIRLPTGLAPSDIQIFIGPAPDAIDCGRPVAWIHEEGRVLLKEIPDDRRRYFLLRTGGSADLVFGERRIGIEGTFNFRDLGGYPARDGKRVRWGQVYRSDHLAHLTDKGRGQLQDLGIRTVCDLRAIPETRMAPDALPPGGGILNQNYPVGDRQFDTIEAFRRMERGDTSWLTPDFMVRAYLRNLDRFGATWGRIFKRIGDAGARPLVFHCTAGKDRAGTCAALLLLALGVSEETVIHDHGLSNHYMAPVIELLYPRFESWGIRPEDVQDYFTAPRKCILAVLDHLRAGYGSVDAYLHSAARLSDRDMEALRDQLLE